MSLTPPEKIDPNGRVAVPVMQHPAYRAQVAIDRGVEHNILFKVWGGLGDQICTEPTLRFALSKMQNCKVSLAAEIPELFNHLNFHRVFDLKEERPVYENYLVFETITPPDDSNMVWLFFSHMLTNCVDFPSLCALRSQLPVEAREVRISATSSVPNLFTHKGPWVAVHAGRHWPSKTFPKAWWDEVLKGLIVAGIRPILIGANTDDNRGTVDVNPGGCFDLRNKLSVMDSIWLLQKAGVLLTNDSAPLHMAVTGNAWIGFIATCKHPDFITHWRQGEWGWRMENLGLGGMWDLVDAIPNKNHKVLVDEIDPAILATWLPEPKDVVAWTLEKLSSRG